MIQRTLAFLQAQTDWKPEQHLLLAVSGGVDSMVMLHIFQEAKKQGFIRGRLAIAHCNFGLRQEAYLDAQLVQSTAQRANLPYYETQFDTTSFAERQQISIQMAARELRYLWFEKLLIEHNFDRLLTAHHLDDSLETALLNFTRGSGLKGLIGIPPQREHILRPLLWVSREEIKNYAKKQKIHWREDLSNQSLKYHRNLLRLEIIPLLKKINPRFLKVFKQTSHNLSEAEKIYQHAILGFRQMLLQKQGANWRIPKEAVLKTPAPQTILYELIKAFNFSTAISEQAVQTAHKQSGSIFLSPTHEMLNDRQHWIIREKSAKKNKKTIKIHKGQKQLVLPDGRTIKIHYLKKIPKDFKKDTNKVYLDTFKLDFPLQVRLWRQGDHFQPLGMKRRRKKIQDLLTDLKVNRFEKENVWVLTTHDNRIAWVLGYQMAEWCKVNPKTQEAIALEILQETSDENNLT